MSTALTLTPETLPDFDKQMLSDFPFYAAHALRVQTLDGKLVPLVLNTPQLMLDAIINDIRRRGLPVRILVLKARREGVSTYTAGQFYWHTSTKMNRYATLVTHEPEATQFLFSMSKRFHDHAPGLYKPISKYSNAKLLEFNDPNKPGAGLDSAIRVGTAGKEDFGSGQLVHYLHLSECAKWPAIYAPALLTSLLQCVPDEPDTMVIFESTAKGVGGEFYDRFHAARVRYSVELQGGKPIIRRAINPDAKPDNTYASVFLPWFIMPQYASPVPAGFERYKRPANPQDDRQDEGLMASLCGLTDEQLMWRRKTIANKCNGVESVFAQEYPSNPVECFLSTGRPVFDVLKLMALIKESRPPVARYESATSTMSWRPAPDGRLKVWQEPRQGALYVIGGDVAEGLVHGDYSSLDVLDAYTGEQVATWHGHIAPDEFANVCAAVGKRYNYAWLGIERNNHGLLVVTALANMRYPRLYGETIPEPPGKSRRRFGWQTSTKTRPLILDRLIARMREFPGNVKDKDTLQEMLSFKIGDDGKMEAEAGRCDDRVFSLAIATQMHAVCPRIAFTTEPMVQSEEIMKQERYQNDVKGAINGRSGGMGGFI